MDLSIIIVNYNVKFFLEQCLCSTIKATEGLDVEIFVVDNASSDESVDFIKENFPTIKLLALCENIGFAKANNLALKKAVGKYVLYLNPDTIVHENVFKDCISFLEIHKDAGAAGVRMLDGAGCFLPESKRAFPGVWVSFWKICGMAALFPKSKVFNRYALGNLNNETVHEVDVLSGAFMLIRKEIVDKLKGFDEDYFMYGEDIDLSWRIIKAGYKNYYLGQTQIIHFKGESTSKDSLKYVKTFYGAMKIFVNKHNAGNYAFLTKFLLKIAILVKAIFSMFFIVVKQFKNLFPTSSNENHKITFVGRKEDCSSAIDIMSLTKKFNAFETATNVELINKSTKEIVFCIGEISYIDALNFVSIHADNYSYFWHGKKTNSIIGSSERMKTGSVYSTNRTSLKSIIK